MASLGYVDDRAFASAAPPRFPPGYGARRVGAALRAAGIGEEDAADARAIAAETAWAAALRFASGAGSAVRRGRGRPAEARKGAGRDASRRPSARNRQAPGRRATGPNPACGRAMNRHGSQSGNHDSLTA